MILDLYGVLSTDRAIRVKRDSQGMIKPVESRKCQGRAPGTWLTGEIPLALLQGYTAVSQ